MMKRTILDIEGVFSHESKLPRPDSMYGASFVSPDETNTTNTDTTSDSGMAPVSQRFPVKLDMSQVLGGLDLLPEQAEAIVKGNFEAKMDAGSQPKAKLPPSVMMQLSPQDKKLLDEMEA